MPQKREPDVIEKVAGPRISLDTEARETTAKAPGETQTKQTDSTEIRSTGSHAAGGAPGTTTLPSEKTPLASQPIDKSKPASSRKISDASIGHVRRVVAGNPNTPLTVLSRLAEDDNYYIRRTVAGNPKTPVEMLKKLSMDYCPEVRLGVAENPHTPRETLAFLADDNAIDVRYGVAENPHMPEDILLKLARDENPYVRYRALKTLQMLVY